MDRNKFSCLCSTDVVSFSDVFVNVDVVKTQSGEVYPLKNPEKRLRGKLGQSLSPKTTGTPRSARVAPVVVVEI